jgi:hypothetical protein
MLSTTGHIYKIICNLDSSFCYIGSTFNQLRHRWQTHKQDYKDKKGTFSIHKYFDKYDIENFKIILIKSYNVVRTHRKDHKHLHAYETLWISKTKNCVNKYIPFHPLKKEKTKQTKKIYRANNKEQIKEKDKIYKKKNQDKIKENKKKHYQENKEKYKKKQKEYYQENKEKDKIYKKKNQDKIKEYKKKYYQENKEYYSQNWYCSLCDKNMRIDNKLRHLKTKKHILNSNLDNKQNI